jgi:acetyltransferase
VSQLSTPTAETSLSSIARLLNPLDVFFRPKSVAVIGATDKPGHVGRAVLWNLLSSPFGGTVYPVNPKRSAVLGVRAYSTLADIPDSIDLAVIVTPAPSVPGVVDQCAAKGVRGAVIISAGFRETGAHGRELEEQILATARRARMRIIGPNCLGVMCPVSGLNATFAKSIARAGNVALISQSGAICTALLDWSLREEVGFSALLSTGSMLDVDWGALLDHLGNDAHTRSILIYMESIGNARSFLSAAREVALSKPIIVIKAGRTELAAKAAASHTGSLTGSDAVLNAAFRRVGVLRIQDLADVFQMTETLARQPLPNGPRLTIVTNAGGPGVLATDALIAAGAELAPLSSDTLAQLDCVLPPHWSRTNPIDVIGDADPDRYEKTLEIVGNDSKSDGVLVIMTPQAMSDPTTIAQRLTRFAHLRDKPVLASWMGGENIREGVAILNAARIPTFPYPDAAARAFHYMWSYSYNLKGLYETPEATEQDSEAAPKAAAIVESARKANRTLLTEFESKQVLSAYGIPSIPTMLAASEEAAVDAASVLGFPVALKLHSFSITHKTDVDGVKLSIPDSAAVRIAYREIKDSVSQKKGPEHFNGVTVQAMAEYQGYELLIGSSIDPQFGPVLVFGAGGQLVEVFEDRAIALPPLNTTLARRLIEQTRIRKALKGVRGRPPVNLAALEQLLVRFSQMVLEQPWIQEIDINPLLAFRKGLVALDARIVLQQPGSDPANFIKPAIRPYPSKYVDKAVLKDGSTISIRPIRPEDEPRIVKFHESLSEESVYRRYFLFMGLAERTRHERLTRICFIDYDRQMALIAEHQPFPGAPAEIIGVARIVRSATEPEAEYAAIVTDEFQGKGIGSELTKRLIAFARHEHLGRLTASVLFENTPMQKLLEKYGFVFDSDLEEGVLRGTLQLIA